MKNVHLFTLAMILAGTLVSCDKKVNPVNKNASPEAKALLEYLYSIKGEKIISGHHNGSGRDMNRWHKYVEDLTGQITSHLGK